MNVHIQPLLTAEEAATALSICTKTLRKIRERGLPYVTLPSGAIRYKLSDIENYIEGRTVTCHSAPKTRASGTTTSKRGVVDFMAHAAQKTTRKPRP